MIDFAKMEYGIIKGEGNFTIVVKGRFHTFNDDQIDRVLNVLKEGRDKPND